MREVEALDQMAQHMVVSTMGDDCCIGNRRYNGYAFLALAKPEKSAGLFASIHKGQKEIDVNSPDLNWKEANLMAVRRGQTHATGARHQQNQCERP